MRRNTTAAVAVVYTLACSLRHAGHSPRGRRQPSETMTRAIKITPAPASTLQRCHRDRTRPLPPSQQHAGGRARRLTRRDVVSAKWNGFQTAASRWRNRAGCSPQPYKSPNRARQHIVFGDEYIAEREETRMANAAEDRCRRPRPACHLCRCRPIEHRGLESSIDISRWIGRAGYCEIRVYGSMPDLSRRRVRAVLVRGGRVLAIAGCRPVCRLGSRSTGPSAVSRAPLRSPTVPSELPGRPPDVMRRRG